MLTEYGLINMNGRLYDPLLGRFLSTDNFVQEPGSTQSFNRYSYCLNNPLKYNDPSGEIPAFIVAAAIGGILNVAINYQNINNAGQFFKYFAVGAGAGVAGMYAGSFAVGLAGVSGGVIGGAAYGFGAGLASGIITGGGNTWIQGGGWDDVAKGAVIGGAFGGGIGALSGAVLGGVNAWADGKDFWTGKQKMVNLSLREIEPMPVSDMSNFEEVEMAPNNTTLINQNSNTADNYLYHYTNESGYQKIMESQELHSSVGYKHARYGDGVYLTDLNSSNFTRGQLSHKLYKVPYNYRKLQYFLKIDINGLNVIENAPHNFVIPGKNSLPLQGRIIDSGISVFKINMK